MTHLSDDIDIQNMRNGMNRFNAWELSYTARLSEEERLSQFAELFDLSVHYPSEIREKAHREHLEQLFRIARIQKCRKATTRD